MSEDEERETGNHVLMGKRPPCHSSRPRLSLRAGTLVKICERGCGSLLEYTVLRGMSGPRSHRELLSWPCPRPEQHPPGGTALTERHPECHWRLYRRWTTTGPVPASVPGDSEQQLGSEPWATLWARRGLQAARLCPRARVPGHLLPGQRLGNGPWRLWPSQASPKDLTPSVQGSSSHVTVVTVVGFFLPVASPPPEQGGAWAAAHFWSRKWLQMWQFQSHDLTETPGKVQKGRKKWARPPHRAAP